MFTRKRKATFSDAIEPLIALLERTGEQHWLRAVKSYRSGSGSFRSMFGGMGSFTDLIICKANGHRIEKEKEPLANEWLNCLSSICYALTQEKELSAQDAITSCGGLGSQLQGVRCLKCGASYVAESNLSAFDLHYRTREQIRTGIEKGRLKEIFDESWETFDPQSIVSKYEITIQNSNILLTQIFEMMRPCPSCGSDDTAIYRWDFTGRKFQPAKNNLKLRI